MSDVSPFTATPFICEPLSSGESVRDDGAGDALLVAIDFLAGGTGFEGTVDRSVVGFVALVVLKAELERERDARAEAGPETDVGRLVVVVERAGPADIFDRGNETE